MSVWKSTRVRLTVAAGGLLAGAVALGAATLAGAHGGDPSKVHACVKSPNGDVRIVAPAATCGGNETPLDWNIQGPAGPAGPQGPKGDPGPAGGFSGRVVVSAETPLDNAQTKGRSVECPLGKQVIGGGAVAIAVLDPTDPSFQTTFSIATVFQSEPTAPDAQSWTASMRAETAASWKVRVTAICADGAATAQRR